MVNSLKITYWSSDAKMRQAMSYRLYTKYGIVISPQKLRSIFDDYILDDEIERLLEEDKEWFDFFESKVQYINNKRNPFGIYDDVKKRMESRGHYTYKNIPWTENGEVVTRTVRDQYIPDDPNKITCVIVDHYRLLQPEKGDRGVYEAILRFSSQYALDMRDIWKCQVVGVQQQAPTSESQQYNMVGGKTILDKVKPTPDGLGDAKATQQDCNLMLSLFHPARYNQKEYEGIDLTEMNDTHRELFINLNRDGINNAKLQLMFNGAVNYFEEISNDNIVSTYYKIKSIKHH